jgi:hypothetical protein
VHIEHPKHSKSQDSFLTLLKKNDQKVKGTWVQQEPACSTKPSSWEPMERSWGAGTHSLWVLCFF